MEGRNFPRAITSFAILSLVGIVPAGVHAQTSKSAISQPVTSQTSKSGAKSAASASTSPDQPYNWKASFAKVPVGKVPRMADGHPDLQGIWSRAILTPLERPAAQKSTEISAAQAEEIEDVAQKNAIDLRVESTVTPPGEKTTDAYNSFWRDGYWFKVPMTVLHTSQVVDPPDGKVPPLTPAAEKRRDDVYQRLVRPARSPEDRPLSSRCIRPEGSAPPFVGSGPGGQESTLQIVQGPDAVAVRVEAHETQLIYMDGRPRPPEDIQLIKGVSRGHWDGDVLVVETTNFADWGMGPFSAYGTTSKAKLTERWKRLDDTHMMYGFTVDDPGTWTKPWSVEFVMWRLTNQEQLVEYACHEGNVGIEFTLSAARSNEEKEAEDEKQK